MSHRLLAAGAVLALSLTGCSGQATNTAVQPTRTASGAAVAQLNQAAQKAQTINTVNVRFVGDAPGAEGKQAHVLGAGQVQFRPAIGQGMHLNVTSAGRSAQVQFILLGDTIYLKAPIPESMTDGKPWVKFSLQQVSSMSGLDVDAILKQAQQISPAERIQMLTASKDLKQVGTETIAGVQTTHYAGTVSVQDALSKFSGSAKTSLQQLFQRLGAGSIVVDVWVDAQSMPRKLISRINTKNGPVTNTVLYSGYNEPFKVVAPPADEVGTYTGSTPTPTAHP